MNDGADYEVDRIDSSIQALLLKFNELSEQLHLVQLELDQAGKRKARILARQRQERAQP